MEKRSNKNQKRGSLLPIFILLFLVLSISVGYAALSTNLNISGTAKIKGRQLDIHFDSISNITKIGSTTDNGSGEFTPRIIGQDNTPGDKTDDTTLNFSIGLHVPGDKYQFQVKVVNEGITAANARLTVSPVPSNASDYVSWNITGIDTVNGEKIEAGEYKMVTVAIEYKPTVTELPTQDIAVNLSAVVSAEQAW